MALPVSQTSPRPAAFLSALAGPNPQGQEEFVAALAQGCRTSAQMQVGPSQQVVDLSVAVQPHRKKIEYYLDLLVGVAVDGLPLDQSVLDLGVVDAGGSLVVQVVVGLVEGGTAVVLEVQLRGIHHTLLHKEA